MVYRSICKYSPAFGQLLTKTSSLVLGEQDYQKMHDLLRDSFFGRLVRLATSGRYFTYPEEREGFLIPEAYQKPHLSLRSLKTETGDSDAASDEKPRSIASKDFERPGIGELANGLVGERERCREAGWRGPSDGRPQDTLWNHHGHW